MFKKQDEAVHCESYHSHLRARRPGSLSLTKEEEFVHHVILVYSE